jgi:DNA recombination protein RmuC
MTILALLIGLIIGLALGLSFALWRVKDIQKQHQSALMQKTQETEQTVAQMKDAFSTLSMQALSKNTEEFLKLAETKLKDQSSTHGKELEGKKELIDQTLKVMKSELDKVQNTVQTLEKDRQTKFTQLAEQLNRTAEETKQLRETAGTLKEALANNKIRGQWGERMAEDVLRLAGFVEGINYTRQKGVYSEEKTSIPDYTFYLPQERVVHMDVKFPLNNYSAYQAAENETERTQKRDQFIKDVKSRIKEVTKRNYIDQDTLDYILVFIPNEQIYSFIHEHAPDIAEDAMRQKVILCSPMTLYAILAVIRQAVENFNLSQTAGEIMNQVSNFKSHLHKVGRLVVAISPHYCRT